MHFLRCRIVLVEVEMFPVFMELMIERQLVFYFPQLILQGVGGNDFCLQVSHRLRKLSNSCYVNVRQIRHSITVEGGIE